MGLYDDLPPVSTAESLKSLAPSQDSLIATIPDGPTEAELENLKKNSQETPIQPSTSIFTKFSPTLLEIV